MATDQQIQAETAQLKAKWQEKRNDLFSVHISIREVDRRLASWGLAIWSSLGLSPNDVKDNKELFMLPNDKLSKNDLYHKKSLLLHKQEEIEAELRAIQASAKQLQETTKAMHHEQYDQFIRREQDKITAEYKKNPLVFFAEVLFEPQAQWKDQKDEIYRRASQLLAVCELFTSTTDKAHLLQAWQIISRARDIEISEQAPTRIYTIGAERMFAVMMRFLPVEMHGLKLLYDEKYFDRVDYYINELYGARAIDEDETYEELLTALVGEIDSASRKISSKILSDAPRFKRLAKPLREQILRQHTYVSKSKFYLSLIENDVWQNYIKTIDENITAVLKKRKKVSQAEDEFNMIREQISSHIQAQVRVVQAEIELYKSEG